MQKGNFDFPTAFIWKILVFSELKPSENRSLGLRTVSSSAVQDEITRMSHSARASVPFPGRTSDPQLLPQLADQAINIFGDPVLLPFYRDSLSTPSCGSD